MSHDYIYRCNPIRVVDGDTIDVEIDLGFRIVLFQRIRMLGYNAPEIQGGHFKTPLEKELGLSLKKELETLTMMTKQAVMIRTELDSSDKYGRILGELTSGDVAINDVMKTSSLAAWQKLKEQHPSVYN